MFMNPIDDALDQVRRMQALVLERRRFQGYSGKARMLSGTLALLGTLLLASSLVPRDPRAHLLGWAVVFTLSVAINYAALAWWFLFDPAERRTPSMLKPALDAFPALAIGAALTAAAVRHGSFDLLFGIWMSLYGLAQIAYRESLPRGIYHVGLAYLLCGVGCLAWRGVSFVNPWPMGLVFLAGEWAAGIILYWQDHATAAREAAGNGDA